MYKYVDVHCHLDMTMQKYNWFDDFKKFRTKIIKDPNCEKFIHNAVSPESLSVGAKLLELKDVFGSFGIHPHNAKDYNDDIEKKILGIIEEYRPKGKVVSYGEIGLDYHYNLSVFYI
jgi:TatD DNase family protein